MLTKTTISAMRVLIYLGQNGEGGSQSPVKIANDLGESPTYLAKVTGLLVKAGILRSERGAKGGVRLNRQPEEITFQAIMEACQGTIVGNFCLSTEDVDTVCAFHLAGLELHQAIVQTLSKWNLGHLLEKSRPSHPLKGNVPCVLGLIDPGEKAAPPFYQITLAKPGMD
ncbi:MAG: Rrf2 family transcriptional regulator [Acidobacteria bacterium]|nr:Rrf2 family transcriptional regulator [Acidobacteriota bacterium]